MIPDKGDDFRVPYNYYRFSDECFANWHEWMVEIIHDQAPDTLSTQKSLITSISIPSRELTLSFLMPFPRGRNDPSKYYTENEEDYYASEWLFQQGLELCMNEAEKRFT